MYFMNAANEFPFWDDNCYCIVSRRIVSLRKTGVSPPPMTLDPVGTISSSRMVQHLGGNSPERVCKVPLWVKSRGAD